MKIKHILCLLLVLSVTVLTSAACTKESSTPDSSKTEVTAPETENTESNNENTESNESEVPEADNSKPFLKKWNFAETEIINDQGFSVIATPIAYSEGYAKWTIKIIATEPVGVKSLEIRYFTVNGLSIEPDLKESTIYPAYNEAVEVTLPLYKDIVQINNIKEIQSLGVQLSIYNNHEYVTNTQYGLIKTEGSESHVQENPKSSDVIFEEENIKITREGMDRTEGGMDYLLFRVENNNPYDYWVKMETNYINGERNTIRCSDDRYIPANTVGYFGLPYTNALSAIDAEKLESISLEVTYDAQGEEGYSGKTENDIVLTF